MERISEDFGHKAGASEAVDDTVKSRPHRVSVVMPVRNAAATVADQLRALAAQTYTGDWELVVADNGLDDDTRHQIARFANRLPLRLVDASHQRGISTARNRGISAARGQLLLFCDADDVVDPEWLAAMVEAARHGDVIGGRLETRELNAPHVRASRPAPQVGTSLARAHQRAYATGASLGVWADVAEALGGFEETFRTCGDDIDLSWRAQQAGYRLVYAPAAVTHYRYRARTGQMIAQSFRYGLADAMLYRRHRQHLPRPLLRRYGSIVRTLPLLLRGRSFRNQWYWNAGLRMGMLLGAVHPRTWLTPGLRHVEARAAGRAQAALDPPPSRDRASRLDDGPHT